MVGSHGHELAGGPGILVWPLELGLGVAGCCHPTTGRDELYRCSLEHGLPGRALAGLGLTIASAGSESGLDPQQRVRGRAAVHEPL
jgi:hypothetical protein